MARCVILSACPVSPALAGLLREDDFIIACDAGYRNCVPLHCKPHVIVGDFDTAPCPQQEDDEIVVLPHVKDDTDTEYAAKLAVQKGFDEVLLLGGLGGQAAGAYPCQPVHRPRPGKARCACHVAGRAQPHHLCDAPARRAATPKRITSISRRFPWKAVQRASASRVPITNSPMQS